jgi:hypothetical protein
MDRMTIRIKNASQYNCLSVAKQTCTATHVANTLKTAGGNRASVLIMRRACTFGTHRNGVTREYMYAEHPETRAGWPDIARAGSDRVIERPPTGGQVRSYRQRTLSSRVTTSLRDFVPLQNRIDPSEFRPEQATSPRAH